MGGGFPAAGLRRPGRRDGPARAGRPGLPGRHAVREPASRPRPAWPPCSTAPPTLRPPGRGWRRRSRRPSRRRSRPRACRTSCSTRPACSASSSPTGAVPDYADAPTQDVGGYRAFFHAMLAAGVHLPPQRVRSLVRLAPRTTSGGRPGRWTRCRRRPSRGGESATIDADEPTAGDRRPPGPARRGAQPRGRALRPAARLPPVRARPADGRDGRRPPGRPRHRRVVISSPLERAQETAAPIAAAPRPGRRHRRPA